MSRKYSFDPKCMDLAEHFLPSHATQSVKNELAQTIQDAVEDFCMSRSQEKATDHHSGCAVYDVTRPELGECDCGAERP